MNCQRAASPSSQAHSPFPSRIRNKGESAPNTLGYSSAMLKAGSHIQRHWGRLKQKRQMLNWTRSQHSSSTQWDLSSTYSKQGHRFFKGRGSARYSGSALLHRECLLPIRRKRVLKALNPEIQDLATEEGHFKDPTTTTVWGWV